MARYLSRQPAGWFRYHRNITPALRPLLGGRLAIVRYIRNMPVSDAEAAARSYAVQDDQMLAGLRALTPEQATELAAAGGLSKARLEAPRLEAALQSLQKAAALWATLDPRQVAAYGGTGWTAEKVALMKSDVLGFPVEYAPRVERNRALLRKIEPTAAEYSLDALLELWIKFRAPKVTRHHKTTAALLQSFLHDPDYRSVTQTDVRRFIDHLASGGKSRVVQAAHLKNVSALFVAAVGRAVITVNPAAGIKPDGKKAVSTKQPFSGAQLRLILEKAESTAFGGRRNEAVLWMLRLAIFSGLRINELTQLQLGDLTAENGMVVMHIRETDAVTGKRHPEKSVKGGKAWRVPLHPGIAEDFLAYVREPPHADRSDFVFGVFAHNAVGKRGSWLINRFGEFLRGECKITDRRLTLHSCRHRFIDACRNAGMPEERARYLVGHSGGSGVHARYGAGPGLRLLADDLRLVDPLSYD